MNLNEATEAIRRIYDGRTVREFVDPVGFKRIVCFVDCPECGEPHRPGRHPDDRRAVGAVDRVMNS